MADLEKYPIAPPSTIFLSIKDEFPVGQGPISVSSPPGLLAPIDPPVERTERHNFPEGGLKAYLTVVGAFMTLACTFGQLSAFGTFQAWYASHQLQHLPASTISWIGSLQFWVFFFSGATIGRLFDAYGPTLLMITGTLCCLASTITTSFCKEYYQYILSQGILFAVGVGLLFYPSLSSISTHFSKYRATALGVAVAGTSAGGVVYPIILQSLFTKVGFSWGVRISGLVSSLICAVATSMVSSRFTGQKKAGPYFDINTISDARFVLLATGSAFVALGIFIPFFYIVEYAKSLSIPDHMAFYTLAVMNAGGVLGRIAPAYLSDRLGRFNLLIPSAFLSGLLCLVFWLFAKSLVSIMLFSVFYGFVSGSFVSVVTPCVAQISEMAQMGTRIGMLYSIISFPSLVGGPAAGALMARGHGSYNSMILFSGSTMIFGSFFILAAKLIQGPILARV